MDEPYEVNDEQFAAVSALEGRERFEHLLKRICDFELVYVLADGDDLVVLKADENEAPPQVPIWPHPRFADAYRESRGGGAGYTAVALEPFVEELLPDLARDAMELVVMPTQATGRSPAIAADELRRAIISYHEEWYAGWPKYERLDDAFPPPERYARSDDGG